VSRLSHLTIVPLLICSALAAIGYLAFTSGSKFLNDYHLRADKAELQREIDELDSEEQQLSAVRDYLQSDEYIEDVARRILGLVRPGETLVVVSSSAPSPEPAATTQPARSDAREWWQELFVAPPPIATPQPVR